MKQLTKEEKLKKFIEITKNCNISAYLISKETGLNEGGIGKILNNKSKNPHLSTVNILYNYAINYDNSLNIVNEPATLYDNETTEDKAVLTSTYKALLEDVDTLLAKLENAPPDIVTLNQRREALELKAKIQKDLEALK